MNDLPPPPARGERINADLFRRIYHALRRRTPIAGPNVRVVETPAGFVIHGTPGGGHPGSRDNCFRIRYNTSGSRWEVFVPPGSATLGQPCTCLNQSATSGNSNAADDDWKVFSVPSGAGTYNVCAHLKRRARTGSSGTYAPAVFVSAHAGNIAPSADRAGDSASVTIAVITVTQGDGGTTRTITYPRTGRIILADSTASSRFELGWQISVSNDGTPTITAVNVTNCDWHAGTELTCSDTDVTDSESVWVCVDTSSSSLSMSVEADPADDTTSDADSVWVKIYSLDDNAVTSDLRDNLDSVPFYR